MDLLRHTNHIKYLFKSEVSLRAVQVFNQHEDDTRAQKGGTAIMAFDQFAGLVTSVGMDEIDLGRWCWLLIKGKHRHVTRIITAYQSCRHKRSGLLAVGAQHMRYYRKKKRERV